MTFSIATSSGCHGNSHTPSYKGTVILLGPAQITLTVELESTWT